jgi:Co/Zn/Cd efflux system component
MDTVIESGRIRRVVLFVALLNLAYFGVEFAVALTIGSVALFADGIDFLEDAFVDLLIVVALGWSVRWRVRTAIFLAILIFVPGLSALWTAWRKIAEPVAPAAMPLTLTGAGAFVVNLVCALMLTRFRRHESSLLKAAFLSARNDVLANLGIVAAGLVTAYVWRTAWPDVVVGLGIALLNAKAALEVYEAARGEASAAHP